MHFFPSLPRSLPLPTILFLYFFLSLTCCHRGCHATITPELHKPPSATPALTNALLLTAAKNGVTALMGACENGHVEIVALLLQMSDVDSKSKDGNGMTAIMHAKNKHYKKIVEMIEEYDRRRDDVKSEDL